MDEKLILVEALAIDSPEDRSDFLDQKCDDNRVLRRRVDALIKAHDATLNRFVAAKVLAPEIATNALARKRFLREARAAAAVSHPHVITIHAVGQHHRFPFLVMECIDGKTLHEKIDESIMWHVISRRTASH